MKTVDEERCAAPPDVSFRIAADVEGWPDILPHYRWVRFQRKDGFAEGLVEMAAWRPFGPVRYPTWWVSEMTHDPDAGTVSYRHVDGITRGMDVLWRLETVGGAVTRVVVTHDWEGPSWPVVGGFAARRVIGPHFIHVVADRTLAGVREEAERRAGSGPEEGPRPGPGEGADA